MCFVLVRVAENKPISEEIKTGTDCEVKLMMQPRDSDACVGYPWLHDVLPFALFLLNLLWAMRTATGTDCRVTKLLYRCSERSELRFGDKHGWI